MIRFCTNSKTLSTPIMFGSFDGDLVRRIALSKFDRVEIYAEMNHTQSAFSEDRLINSLHCVREGVTLKLLKGNRLQSLTLDSLSTEDVLAGLGERVTSKKTVSPVPLVDPELLQHCLRINLPAQTLLLTSTDRRFKGWGSDGNSFEGEESWAGIETEWAFLKKEKWIRGVDSLWCRDLKTLSERCQNSSVFRNRLRLEKESTEPWPPPRGSVVVEWSPRATGKLIQVFSKAFEGDRVLSGVSFLVELAAPLPFSFGLEDRPSLGRMPFDQEGTPRKAVVFFEKGEPKSFASHSYAASKLKTKPTGHGRRESHRTPLTVGLSNPTLLPEVSDTFCTTDLSWGVHVEDLDVTAWDGGSGKITFCLTDMRLIHQGIVGERVEPLTVTTSIEQVLGSWKAFGKEAFTQTLPAVKQTQRWLTDVTTPTALSPAFEMPGAVPPSHYW